MTARLDSGFPWPNYFARKAFSLALLLGITGFAAAQARPTASKMVDVQAGAAYIHGDSDYSLSSFNGYSIYADADFWHGLGAELEYNYLSDLDSYLIYERTYEVGGRYSRRYGRFQPFGKVMYGRGVFQYPQNSANLAYNMYSFGGGVDYHLRPYLNVRGQYEAQRWTSFNPSGLTPSFFSIGAAYHFK